MIYITGDTHGNFKRISEFCKEQNTTTDDILIILGDAGINYNILYDYQKKEYIAKLPITLFCIHGNHEIRPQNITTYKEHVWNGGAVFIEGEYPNIIFAKDGEIYDFEGKQTIVIGGAYSVDKFYRLQMNYGWWEDEQPSDEIKSYVEHRLEDENYKIDVVLSHTAPEKYIPRETFLPFIDQSTVDDSTEKWLDTIEDKLEYKRWYLGHYHINKTIDKVRILFEDILEFN